MIIRLRWCIVLLVMLSALYGHSQVITSVKRYSTNDGLPDNRITSITRDREGFMWFSSWSGISRFDGHKFLIYKSFPGDNSNLQSNRIEEIIDAPGKGFLWLRAYDDHVYRFDKRKQQFATVADLLKDSSVATIRFSRILFADDKEVWLQTKDRGIFLIGDALTSKPSITNFSADRSTKFRIPSNKISFFFLDKQRNAWIGTEAGLRVLFRKTGTQLEMRTIIGTESLVFAEVEEDKKYVWLLSNGSLIFGWDKEAKQIKNVKVSASKINDLAISNEPGTIYCTTSDGALLSVSSDGETMLLGQLNSRSPLLSIYRSVAGELWVESNEFGVVRYSPVTKAIRPQFPANNYKFRPQFKNIDIFEGKNGVVWVNLIGQGLKVYNRQQERFEAFGPEFEGENQALSRVKFRHYYDPSGVLWLLPDDGGVEKIVFKKKDFQLLKLKPNSAFREENEIRSVYTDTRNRTWVGTKSGDLYAYKNGERISNPIKITGKCPSGIYSIIEDRNGNMWLGTKSDGLVLAEPLKSDRSAYRVSQHLAEPTGSNSIYCFLNDSKGRLWAGTFGAGLLLIEYDKGKVSFKSTRNSFFRYPEINYSRIRHLQEDSRRRIWIGTTEGLLVVDPNISRPEDYQFHQYRKQAGNIHSLGGNDVQYIFKDSHRNMWVLTSTGGLNLAFVGSELNSLRFKNYSGKQGFPSDFLISCIEDRKQNLWITTQNGISKFSLLSKKIQNFNTHDGLPNMSFSEAACTKTASGEILFGTSAGVLRFHPSQIKSEDIAANLALTSFHVNSQEIRPGEDSPLKEEINYAEEVVLKYDQNNLSIAFTMLDYHSLDKQNYYCHLLGYDEEWRRVTSERSASYTKLPPGKYTFEVKCVNEELYSGTPIKSLQITILPPIWKTWWAYLFYLILLLLLLAFVRQIVSIVMKLRQRIEVEKRISELKLKFFTQVSHELRTPLTLIVNPLEEVIRRETLSDSSRTYLGTAVKNARRMVRLVNQLLDLRKVQGGKASLKISEVEIVSFVKDISNYFTETLRNRELIIEFFPDVPASNMGVDIEKLDIVIYNLLANAIKFSPDGSTIQVQIKASNTDCLRIEVADQGVGVSKNELKEIFELYFEGAQRPFQASKGSGIGLALSKELVELHGGRIYAIPNSPKGLRVIVKIKPGEVNSHDIYAPAQSATDEDSIEGSVLLEANQESAEKPLIILVEDNDELRNFLAASLSDFYNVEQAKDGQEGFEKVTALLPDLVLSDVMMPRLTGIQMLERLKNEPATSHIPVILLTARHSVESQIQGLNSGADYYITKPFQMPLLQASISNIMSRRNKLFQKLQEAESAEEAFDYTAITASDKIFLEKVIAIVDEKLSDSTFNIDDFAESLRMSRSAFFRKFKALTNLAPVEFLRDVRLKKSKELFLAGDDHISDVAYSVGFTTPRYFSTCFRMKYGQSPREYVAAIKKAADK